MKKQLNNTDKVMVSSRIPVYVKQYIEEKNLKIIDVIMKGFDEFRATDKDHALNRLDYHEKRVLHWRHIVLQHDEECNTKHHICNTIKHDFVKQGRGTVDSRRQDMSWCEAKAESLIDEGVIITPRELYEFCTRKDNKK